MNNLAESLLRSISICGMRMIIHIYYLESFVSSAPVGLGFGWEEMELSAILLSPLVLFLEGSLWFLYSAFRPSAGCLYSHLRNPSFFSSLFHPAPCLGRGCIFLPSKPNPVFFVYSLILGFLGITILTASYRQGFFHHISMHWQPNTDCADAVKTRTESGRYLVGNLSRMTCWSPRRPNAWYWLNWSSQRNPEDLHGRSILN
jgi:hypothetical protein